MGVVGRNMRNSILEKLMYLYAFLQCFVAVNEKYVGILANALGFGICYYLAIEVYRSKKKSKQLIFLLLATSYFLFQYIYIILNGSFKMDSIYQGIKIMLLIYLAIFLTIYKISTKDISKYMRFTKNCIDFHITLIMEEMSFLDIFLTLIQ